MELCVVAASEQRVVSISGREAPTAQFSPAAEALVLCAAPILQEEGDLQKLVRLVVPSSQASPLRVPCNCGHCYTAVHARSVCV